jgi:hypothetical protein
MLMIASPSDAEDEGSNPMMVGIDILQIAITNFVSYVEKEEEIIASLTENDKEPLRLRICEFQLTTKTKSN